jgi:hypothetical protein
MKPDPQKNQTKPQSQAADYSLLIERMEKALLHGADPDAYAGVLGNPDKWTQLTVKQLLRWAELCQMAGAMDSALGVYEYLHQRAPESELGWQGHLELLVMLNRRKDAVRMLAAARSCLPDSWQQKWQSRLQKTMPVPGDEPDMEAASRPFEQMRHRQELIECFMQRFSGRQDVFARQWSDRETGRQGYVPVRQAMTARDVEDHLSGKKTYGFYLLDARGHVKTAVIDADLKTEYRKQRLAKETAAKIRRERTYMFRRIKEAGSLAGAAPLVEFSGSKGFHFWFFFENPVPAAEARAFAHTIMDEVAGDLSVFSLEVFPKQDKLSGKGLGNLVKLPLGIHRATGKQSFFVECRDRDTDAQLMFLKTTPLLEAPALESARQHATARKVAVHPRMEKWAADYPELHTLETRCPPLGQIIAACRDRHSLSSREEKVLYQTIGFLPRRRTLLHYLLAFDPEYNPHLVDYRLSRIRGTPLGCRRIHSLLDYTGDFCQLPDGLQYRHPLAHIKGWQDDAASADGSRAGNLARAIEQMRIAICQVQQFLPPEK